MIESRRSNAVKIGITMGDPAGIGAEIIVKALGKNKIKDGLIPIVIGDYEVMADALRICNISKNLQCISFKEHDKINSESINIIDLKLLQKQSWKYKEKSAKCGRAAFEYIKEACELATSGVIDAIVTCPINKEAINMAGFHYAGHTEIFEALTNSNNCAMLLHSNNLNIIHATTHVSMEDACRLITKKRVMKTIELAEEGMKLMGNNSPRIAVAGFNAHSSENGLFGSQEKCSIIPAVIEAKNMGKEIEGPISPDTVFAKAMAGEYDIVVAMYHDQGHIPFKLNGFKYDAKTGMFSSIKGVNCTIGLPIIRTSVDHGTAYDMAGEGCANEESLVEAINTAAEMVENRALMCDDEVT